MDDLLKPLPGLRAQLEEIDGKLSDPAVLKDQRRMRDVGRERARVLQLLRKMEEYEAASKSLEEARQIIHEGKDDDLVAIAGLELEDLETRRERTREELRRLLIPKDPADERNAMVEIRAGTGGDEATLFVGDMFRLYGGFAERRGYKLELMTSHPTEIGGWKEIVFNVIGNGAFGLFKFEGGVHRVQRVPATEASGRLHTSAVSVAVLPEAEEVDVEIRTDDLKVDVYRSSGPGGQSVNTTDSAVRIRHVPTGIVVQCQDERSQIKNKAKAMKVLRAKVLDHARQEREAKTAAARKSMVSTGDRSAKIRTYNFPQGRVTDHRIGLTLYNLHAVMEGAIDEIVEKLQVTEAENLLAARTHEPRG
jgi:peptide chain release factor 1